MSELVSNQQRHEILRNPVKPRDIDDIIICCNHAWPEGIYPYKGLMNPNSWKVDGELGAAIESGDMFSSVVRKGGRVVAHAALVTNKFGLLELGRVFTNDPGKGYGTQAVEGVFEEFNNLGVEYAYMGRSYNRTPMMGVATKVAEINGLEIAVVGASPHLYHEVGSDGNEYIWGEVDSLIIQKGSKLAIPLPNDIPDPVKRMIKIITDGNLNIVTSDYRQDEEKAKDKIKIARHIGLVNIQDSSQQRELIDSGCVPVGVLPMKGSWYVKFFQGDELRVIQGRMSNINPGVSPIYCSDAREYHIINSILQK